MSFHNHDEDIIAHLGGANRKPAQAKALTAAQARAIASGAGVENLPETYAAIENAQSALQLTPATDVAKEA